MALELDNVNDICKTSSTSAWLQGNKSAITIEYWLYLNAVDVRLSANAYDNGSAWVTTIDNEPPNINRFRTYFVGTTGAWHYFENVTFVAGQWYHVAVTWDGSFRRGYVNGASGGAAYADTGTMTGQGVNAYVAIGNYAGFKYNGKIAEFRMWNYARTQAQIQAGMARRVLPQSGLEVYYRCDEGALNKGPGGSTLVDLSGNGNHSDDSGSMTDSDFVDGPPIQWNQGD